MNLALSGLASDDEMDNEDKINAMMAGRKLLKNASYFAFTATPKNKTLETFTVAIRRSMTPSFWISLINRKLLRSPFPVTTELRFCPAKPTQTNSMILWQRWKGILETIDLESYRNEARESLSIKLEDSDSEIAPVPAGKVGHIIEPEMNLLSVILSDFNDMFGNINWNDADNVRRQILEIPAMVSRDEKYQNAMKNSDEQSARLESERALQQVIFAIMADNMELFKQFQDNPSFKKWLSDLVFHLTYSKEGKPYEAPLQEHKSVIYNFDPQQEMVAEEQPPYGEKNE